MEEVSLEQTLITIMQKALARDDLIDRMDEIVSSDNLIDLLEINSLQALQIIALVEIDMDVEFDDNQIGQPLVNSLKVLIEEINRLKKQ